jgi:hypothetical protein
MGHNKEPNGVDFFVDPCFCGMKNRKLHDIGVCHQIKKSRNYARIPAHLQFNN